MNAHSLLELTVWQRTLVRFRGFTNPRKGKQLGRGTGGSGREQYPCCDFQQHSQQLGQLWVVLLLIWSRPKQTRSQLTWSKGMTCRNGSRPQLKWLSFRDSSSWGAQRLAAGASERLRRRLQPHAARKIIRHGQRPLLQISGAHDDHALWKTWCSFGRDVRFSCLNYVSLTWLEVSFWNSLRWVVFVRV